MMTASALYEEATIKGALLLQPLLPSRMPNSNCWMAFWKGIASGLERKSVEKCDVSAKKLSTFWCIRAKTTSTESKKQMYFHPTPKKNNCGENGTVAKTWHSLNHKYSSMYAFARSWFVVVRPAHCILVILGRFVWVNGAWNSLYDTKRGKKMPAELLECP